MSEGNNWLFVLGDSIFRLVVLTMASLRIVVNLVVNLVSLRTVVNSTVNLVDLVVVRFVMGIPRGELYYPHHHNQNQKFELLYDAPPKVQFNENMYFLHETEHPWSHIFFECEDDITYTLSETISHLPFLRATNTHFRARYSNLFRCSLRK